jgi:hypothetical protein
LFFIADAFSDVGEAHVGLGEALGLGEFEVMFVLQPLVRSNSRDDGVIPPQGERRRPAVVAGGGNSSLRSG